MDEDYQPLPQGNCTKRGEGKEQKKFIGTTEEEMMEGLRTLGHTFWNYNN